MKKFILAFSLAFSLALFFVPAEAATDHNVVESQNYRIIGHQYTGDYENLVSSEIGDIEVGGVSSTSYVFAYNIEWPVSVDVFIKNLASYSDSQTFSGYVCFPLIFNQSMNSNLIIELNRRKALSAFDSDYIYGWGYNDYNFHLLSRNGNGISYNFFSKGGQYYLSIMFDNVPLSSFSRSTNYMYFSVNALFTGGFWVESTNDVLSSNLSRPSWQPFMTVTVDPSSSVNSWLSGWSVNDSLAVQIADGINSSTEIDSIINYLLLSYTGSSAFFSNVLPYIQNIDSVLSSLYNYISSATTSYNTLLNSILSVAQNQGTTLTNLYDLLDSGGLISSTLADQLTQLRNIYSYTYNTNNMINRFISALVSPATPFYDPSVLRTNLTSFLVDAIQKAISDFEISIQIDQDTSVNIEVTNNDIKNIYNSQQSINNFETNISLDFERYIQAIDFTMIDPQNGPTGLVSATAAGKGWIESIFNAMGPYNYLVIVTLLVGLVAGLIGPINRFIVSRFK